MSDEYNNPDEEAEAAQDRINRIVGGGASSAGGSRAEGSGDPLGGSEALERARSRVSTGRAVKGDSGMSGTAGRGRTMGARPSVRSQQAIMVIGGVVVLGIFLVLLLVVVAPLLRGEGGAINLPFIATDTPTPTATPTTTPTPTPTRTAPATLTLPQLPCIFQSGISCFDFCNDPANAPVCQQAQQFVENQDASWNVFFQCVAPGPGPNVGEPLECLRDAWRANNP